MINELKIKNFKSIDKLNIKFKKLNILCGENASGKTSIIHSILLCSQNNKNSKNVDGNIIKIGEYEELKNVNKNSEITIIIKDKNKYKSIIYKRNENSNLNQKNILLVDSSDDNNFQFEHSIFYLSSNRIGVMDTYAKGNFLFGINGAETISFLFNHQEDLMSNEYMQLFNKIFHNSKVSENRKFIEHVRYWMEEITSENISISSINKTNQYILSFGENQVRPINTGSGYSFLLPIIIACLGVILINIEVPTIIIENPEIFLHPEAQQKLMRFFSFCKNFCQIIIETHSEYIIKSTIESSKMDTNVYVSQKDANGYTILSKYRGKDFKTNSYLEILYKSFGIITPEFHILLYGLVQQKYNKKKGLFESSTSEFDKYLNGVTSVPCKKWEHVYRGKTSIYKTLPTFIRNKIDHPEAINPETKKHYSYTKKELKISIDFLLSQL